MDILNKPTERGYLAYAHTSRVATTYQHWPKEAYEANNQARLPTLRILSYIQNIAGAELEHIRNLQVPNHIASSLNKSGLQRGGRDQDQTTRKLPTDLPTKDYMKKIRNQCQPLKYSDRLLKHLFPLWGEGVSDWTQILEKQTTSEGHTTVYIINAKAIHAKLISGDRQRTNNNLELSLSTLRTTQIHPTSAKNIKNSPNPPHANPINTHFMAPIHKHRSPPE